MPQRLAFGPLGEARSLGCPATPPDRVAHFRSVHDLPVAPGRLERTIARSPVLSSEDGAIRWKEGERLHHLLEQACRRFGANDAVVTDQAVITYRDLDKRANQVARYLIDQGIEPGDRVGLLFDKIGRDLSRVAGGDEGQRRLCAARSRFPDRAHWLHPGGREHQNHRVDVRLRRATRRVQRAPRPSRHRERRPSTPSPTRPSPRTRSAPPVDRSSATSSTPRGRPASPRASSSSIPASAISSGSRRSATALRPAIASIRA